MGEMTTVMVRGVVLLASVIVVSGCSSSEALTLTGDELPKSPCSQMIDIPVEELNDLSTVECDPLGSTLVFPDGQSITIGAGGGSSSGETDYTYAYQDVGTLGIVATRYLGQCRDQEVWGSSAAIEKVTEAFGESLGDC
jgi:hypothetical protein